MRWKLPSNFLTYAHFKEAVRNLDMRSSPGLPYMRFAPTNGILFKIDEDGEPDEEVLLRFYEAVKDRILTKGPSDVIRLFIKAEPHKLKKLENHRYRLISSVSVLDQIIDHMLFDNFNDICVDNWPLNPIKVGFSHFKGGWRAIPVSQGWIATDKTSWDWTVMPWMQELCFEIRSRLCDAEGEKFSVWKDLAQYRYNELFSNPTFMTSSGVLLKQRVKGIQKSGSVNTLIDNSLMQWIIHARCQLELNQTITNIFTMGDDVLQEQFPGMDGYFNLMSQFCILKQTTESSEFAGFHYKNGTIEPLYKGKHAFNLLHADPVVLESMALSYSLIYHRSQDKDWMNQTLQNMGVSVFPNEIADLIVDGDE